MTRLTEKAKDHVRNKGELAGKIASELDTTVYGVLSMVNRNSQSLTSYFVVHIIASDMNLAPEDILIKISK